VIRRLEKHSMESLLSLVASVGSSLSRPGLRFSRPIPQILPVLLSFKSSDGVTSVAKGT
jgi:hypothetical protein